MVKFFEDDATSEDSESLKGKLKPTSHLQTVHIVCAAGDCCDRPPSTKRETTQSLTTANVEAQEGHPQYRIFGIGFLKGLCILIVSSPLIAATVSVGLYIADKIKENSN